jgi:hypothetical protein
MRRLFSALALFATLAACGSSSTAPAATIAGSWVGPTGTQVLSLTLVTNNGMVSGSGTITRTPTGTRALTVSGSFTGSTFTATLSSGIASPFQITATLSESTLTGSLNGSGFAGDPVIMQRQ